ncbi:transposase domain-containing protein [Candidatus Mycobacterium methanotrophicum]|uniref:Transposase domain-containing protein n=1 Tax=Candidatus Mycobacterium methanotrophicum TaxID=2943498 RepID=A0ABY4QM12_9MYCO|nr:transposase domain-containing protein [Candidatus Mycobacterium methanotrophicum]UQX10981.1 transposase domain-containing protein [Candidatus Mycobacterium methanotrophicum]
MPVEPGAGRDARAAMRRVVETVTRTVTVAAGVFAPGHLGELTRQAPFELVDSVLEQARAAERRLRELPSRVGVYFDLALGLYPGLGYRKVWDKLTCALDPGSAAPSATALRALRRRLGPAPVQALFEVLAERWPSTAVSRPKSPTPRRTGP